MPTEEVRTFVPTAPAASGIGINIALECRVGDSQPPPDIVWFQDGTPLVENLAGNAVRFLEGGRWAYIRDIETFPREYYCEVSNARMNGSERSPQTYFINGTGLVAEMNFVYKEIGDLTAFSKEGENDNFEFSYVTSEETANRLCFFYSNDEQVPGLGAVGTITNLPAPPAEVNLECRSNQVTVVSSGTVTVQRKDTHTHTHTLTHPPTTHTPIHPHIHTGKAVITMDPSNAREVIVGSSSAMPTSFSCANTGYSTI